MNHSSFIGASFCHEMQPKQGKIWTLMVVIKAFLCAVKIVSHSHKSIDCKYKEQEANWP